MHSRCGMPEHPRARSDAIDAVLPAAVEETVRAMNWIIDHGYAFYWCAAGRLHALRCMGLYMA